MSNIFTEIKLNLFVQYHPRVIQLKRKSKEIKKDEKFKHLSLMNCQEIIAKLNGFNSWHHFMVMVKKSYEKELNNQSFVITKEPKLDYDHMLLGHDINLNNYKWQDTIYMRTHQLIIGENFNHKYDMFLIKQSIEKQKDIYVLNLSDKDIDNIIELSIKNKREKDIRIFDFSDDKKYKKYMYSFNDNWNHVSSGYLAEFLFELIKHIDKSDYFIKGSLNLISLISMSLVYLRDTNNKTLTLTMIKDALSLSNIKDLMKNNEFPSHIEILIKRYLDCCFSDDLENREKTKEDYIVFHKKLEDLLIEKIDNLINSGIFDSSENRLDLKNLLTHDDSIDKKITIFNFTNTQHAKQYQHLILSTIRTFVTNWLSGTIEIDSSNKNSHSINNLLNTKMGRFNRFMFFRDMILPSGIAVWPAQARSAGILLNFSYESFEKMDEYLGRDEMLSIVANSNNRILSNKAKEDAVILSKHINIFKDIININETKNNELINYPYGIEPNILKTYGIEKEVKKDYFWLIKNDDAFQLNFEDIGETL